MMNIEYKTRNIEGMPFQHSGFRVKYSVAEFDPPGTRGRTLRTWRVG